MANRLSPTGIRAGFALPLPAATLASRPVIGRLADLLRLAWGLLYWNIRKSWFQLRRGRSPCPCQSASDSGRAYETICEACVSWHRPAAFRRVCPLLVETPDGLRCSVDTERVRPFWLRAFGFYGGSILTLYLAAALTIFAFLRTVGYPISIVHLVWPGSWHRVGQVRGWFFMDRAQRAMAHGQMAEGMLYLANAYEFDPDNYTVAFTLAQKLQITQPHRSDEIFRQLVVAHPEQKNLTYQVWFRALLARGDFPAIEALARARIVDDPANAAVWMRALIFASRQTGSEASLRQLLESAHAAIRPWHPLLETELLLRAHRVDEARSRLRQPWLESPPFAFFYQISERIALGDGIAAVDLLEAHRARLDDNARAALLLRAYATLGASQSVERLATRLLDPPVSLASANLVAAHLIRQPNPAVFERLFFEFGRSKIPLTDDSLETYLALYCAAGVVGDWDRMHTIAGAIRTPGRGNTLTLGAVEAFFRGQTTRTRISGLLPALPMPLEVHYALLERYPGPRTPAPAASTP